MRRSSVQFRAPAPNATKSCAIERFCRKAPSYSFLSLRIWVFGVPTLRTVHSTGTQRPNGTCHAERLPWSWVEDKVWYAAWAHLVCFRLSKQSWAMVPGLGEFSRDGPKSGRGLQASPPRPTWGRSEALDFSAVGSGRPLGPRQTNLYTLLVPVRESSREASRLRIGTRAAVLSRRSFSQLLIQSRISMDVPLSEGGRS
jgi:hypothetical protein